MQVANLAISKNRKNDLANVQLLPGLVAALVAESHAPLARPGGLCMASYTACFMASQCRESAPALLGFGGPSCKHYSQKMLYNLCLCVCVCVCLCVCVGVCVNLGWLCSLWGTK